MSCELPKNKGSENNTRIAIEREVADCIYVALKDAYDRLDGGTMQIKRCINYFEKQYGYAPPEGWQEDRVKEE